MTEEQTQAHEHAHPNYIKIWAILTFLLVLSILGPMLGIKYVTLIAAFGIALVKAAMVGAYFMHLNIEKRYVWYMLFTALLFLSLFFFGVSPDVMKPDGTNWVNHATSATSVEAGSADSHH